MTDKNTSTTKATATGTKPVATPKLPPAKEMLDDIYGKGTIEELNKRTKAIKDSIGKIDRSFETIAFNLYWIDSKGAYKAKGADSIAKYASDMFGYEKTTCYSLIAIVERFAKRDENGSILEEFDPKYKGYSSSKLSLMTGLTYEQIEGLNPDMSVRDIKKYVSSLKEKPLSTLPDGSSGEETGDDVGEDNSGNALDSTASDNHRKHLFTFNGFDDYNGQIDKFDSCIHALFKNHSDLSISVVIEYDLSNTEVGG